VSNDTTTRALDTMQTQTFGSMRAMSAAIAQRFILEFGTKLSPRVRSILNSRDVLAITVPDAPGCVRFSVQGDGVVLRKIDGVAVY
jgi:hypothetical protein